MVAIAEVQEVKLEERLLVHFVLGVQIGEEPVLEAVGQDSEADVGDVEVAEQLGVLRLPQVRGVRLTFENHLGGAVQENGVIDLLAFLDANVGDQFGRDFAWVEHVIAEHLDEWEDEGVLGRLFGGDVGALGGDAVGEFFEPVSEVRCIGHGMSLGPCSGYLQLTSGSWHMAPRALSRPYSGYVRSLVGVFCLNSLPFAAATANALVCMVRLPEPSP